MAYNFLAPIDQKVRDDGYKFVSQDKYLQNPFGATSGISYAGDGSPVSYANSGIMSQAPIPAPLKYIPREGGGEGRGPPGDPEDIGAVTADDYGYGPVGNDVSMNMTDEEQAGVDSINNANVGFTGAMQAAFAHSVLGPIAAMKSLNTSQKREKEKAIAEAKAAQQQRDFEAAKANQRTSNPSGKLGGPDGTSGGDYTGGAGFASANAYGGDGTTNDQGADTFAKDGGRIGYFFGGRVNYKAGGRIGFKGGGGQIGGTDDMSGGSKSGKGFSDKDDTREQYGAKGQYDKGPTNNNNNGGNNNPPTINKTSIIDKIRYNPIINNPLTRLVGRVGMYSVNPSLMGLDYRTASQLKGVYDKATEDLDDEDVTMNKFANGGLASIL